MDDITRNATNFILNEKEFHLGFLPTEQPHSATKGLAETIAHNLEEGIRLLQKVDTDIIATAERVCASKEYTRLVAALVTALTNRKKICFSGCGATGRLAILLESMCRRFCRNVQKISSIPLLQERENIFLSIMTGGDYALVRSVESFEDYESFGRQQARESGIGTGDLLIAVTEGGETSSVIGTAKEALTLGAQVFFACNNPPQLLAKHIERSRQIIEDPRVTVLDLSSGPMALAGSTRMQATTSELLLLGAALETAITQFLHPHISQKISQAIHLTAIEPQRYAADFAMLLTNLANPKTVTAMAQWAEMESSLYDAGGAITYFNKEFLLDIFTDTTERAPTFSWPPFRKYDDTLSPRPLAFAKNPLLSTPDTWNYMLKREPRCLSWDSALYQKLRASEQIIANPPSLTTTELYKFLIGNEKDFSRIDSVHDTAIIVLAGKEWEEFHPSAFNKILASINRMNFPACHFITIGEEKNISLKGTCYHIPCDPKPSILQLWEHLAIKIIFNTVSTATAAKTGRVINNWMAFVETTNKKLIDRGTRLISELSGISYEQACWELHKTFALLKQNPMPEGKRISPVAATLKRIEQKP